MKAIFVKVGQYLTSDQRKKIINIVGLRGNLSPSTIYRYLIGKATPQYLYRVLIKDVINEVLGENYTTEDLWPGE